jgi:hypothetical protein
VENNVKVQTLVLFGVVGVLEYVCFVFHSLYAYSFLTSDLMLLSILFI